MTFYWEANVINLSLVEVNDYEWCIGVSVTQCVYLCACKIDWQPTQVQVYTCIYKVIFFELLKMHFLTFQRQCKTFSIHLLNFQCKTINCRKLESVSYSLITNNSPGGWSFHPHFLPLVSSVSEIWCTVPGKWVAFMWNCWFGWLFKLLCIKKKS